MGHQTKLLRQRAYLWAIDGRDSYGEPEIGGTAISSTNGVEIKCRWEIGKNEFPGPNNETIIVDGVAYVDRTITVGSLMWLGREIDLPSPLTDVLQVVDYSEKRDIKGNNPRRRVLLQKFKDI